MNFNDLDVRMRVFETARDQAVVPGQYIVVRLDGRGFTRLTKEVHAFEAPYDERFRDMMLKTVEHLMQCGVRAVYGYTQSDEISILLHRETNAFGRKVRKLISILAGEASAKFSLELGDIACFDARLSELPRETDVVDYFRWRAEDAHRNALNSHCYWMRRKQGEPAKQADAALRGMSVSDKNEMLFQNGINFNDLPTWQKRGSGLIFEEFEKVGRNPLTGDEVLATRTRICRDLELPLGEAYSDYLRRVLEGMGSA